MRGTLIIGVYISFHSICFSQVAHKSQPIGIDAESRITPLVASQVTILIDTNPKTDTSFEDKKLSKIAPKDVNINYLPLFGGYDKTEEQLISDELFRSDCDKEFATRNEAAQFFNKMGWQYLREGDKTTAVYRFNLSYLLNQDNYEVLWGLGVIEYQAGNLENAITLMSEGIQLSDYRNYVFMTDLATIFLQSAIKSPSPLLETVKAKTLLSKAIEIQPQYTPAFVQLTIAELLENNLDAAWANFHKAYNLNPAELSKELLAELLGRKEDPQGVFIK